MCLTIYCKSRAERRKIKKSPFVAKEDFYVWKRFIPHPTNKKLLESPYKGFIYEKKHIYSNGVSKPFSFNAERYNSTRLHIHQGLHAYLKNSKYNLSCGEVMKRCIVPKGSIYYKNDYEIVTNNLIIP